MKLRLAHHVAALLLPTSGPSPPCRHGFLGSRPYVVFSGTQNWKDLVIDDLNVSPRRWPDRAGRLVHGGFAARTNRLSAELEEFIVSNDNFVLGGHSLGGCCAILLASKLESQEKNVCGVYTFGVPQSATPRFQEFYKAQELWNKTHNFITPRDPIVHRIPYGFYKTIGQYYLIDCDEEDEWEHHEIAIYLRGLLNGAKSVNAPL